MINWRAPLLRLMMRAAGRKAFARCAWMESVARRPRKEVLRIQRERLARLLAHAGSHVPYYRELFSRQSPLTPGGEVNFDAFAALPLLDKAILRERFDDLKSHPPPPGRRSYLETSGGSTGEPVRFLHDTETWDWNVAATLFLFTLAGKRAGEPEAKLWGSERDLLEGGAGITAVCHNFLYNRIELNSFRMTFDSMRNHIARINGFRPAVIWAYVDSADQLARFAEAERLLVHSPRAVVVTAGTLTRDGRETIERVFRAPVLNQYGSREVGAIAAEGLDRRGLHVFDFNQYLEILRPDGSPCPPGELGEIVITSLCNYTMPLIRYRIGDRGRWADDGLAAPTGLSRLAEISGRVTDHFIAPDGGMIHGEFFTHLFYHQSGIVRFKIVQEEMDRIRIRIIPRSEETIPAMRPALDDITRRIRLVMGAECRVDVEFVSDIPETPSGKYRYTESKIAPR